MVNSDQLAPEEAYQDPQFSIHASVIASPPDQLEVRNSYSANNPK